MSGRPRTAAERLERLRRDQEAHRRLSLVRRSSPRFHTDLALVPHLFLLLGRARMAPLQKAADSVRLALRGEATWTLDTAARMLTTRGFLASPDLTGYLPESALARAVAEGLVGEPVDWGLTVDPLYHRPAMLIVHLTEEPPPRVVLPSGELVVSRDFLIRDILGTLGWRPDLLTRLEASLTAHPAPAGEGAPPPGSIASDPAPGGDL
jgi:hypothetical protein